MNFAKFQITSTTPPPPSSPDGLGVDVQHGGDHEAPVDAGQVGMNVKMNLCFNTRFGKYICTCRPNRNFCIFRQSFSLFSGAQEVVCQQHFVVLNKYKCCV
jgi:hypothetical protein